MDARAPEMPWTALELAATAAECQDMDEVRNHLLPALAAATGAELAIYHQISLDEDVQEYGVAWPDDERWATSLAAYPAVMHHSPLVRHFLAVGRPGVVSLGQLVTTAEWHRNPVYCESHRMLGVEDHLALVLCLDGGRGHAVTLARPRGSFATEDHLLLGLLAPHLRAAVRRSLAHPVGYRVLRTVPEPAWTLRTGPAVPRPDGPVLTDREREVLSHAGTGRTSQQMSRDLGIAPRTVDKHLENAFRKLQASCRSDAVQRLLELGMGLDGPAR